MGRNEREDLAQVLKHLQTIEPYAENISWEFRIHRSWGVGRIAKLVGFAHRFKWGDKGLVNYSGDDVSYISPRWSGAVLCSPIVHESKAAGQCKDVCLIFPKCMKEASRGASINQSRCIEPSRMYPELLHPSRHDVKEEWRHMQVLRYCILRGEDPYGKSWDANMLV